ncbi:MAG: decarboxylating 6-phosphogluconate dehydrogenase [Flaviflexus sp.]|nr:decarboxylating 6-phosphogluconate dehydrogenase [Flaviflexus sp.]
MRQRRDGTARDATGSRKDESVKLGLIGLGRMGANMRDRLTEGGHEVIGYDRDPRISDVTDLPTLVSQLEAPRIVWCMVPAGEATRSTIDELSELLSDGDIIVEGGNSYYRDDQDNAAALAEKNIRYVDCGVSGGVWGKSVGYGLMVGGAKDDVEQLMPIFDTLRPEGERAEGFVHAGPVGAGHYAKMIHNGIEYGLMQAYAEGYELLAARDDLITDPGATFGAWRKGTVVRSWLLDLMVRALEEDPQLAGLRGYVEDSGEGRWTCLESIEQSVPTPVITAALHARFASRQDDSPAMKAVAALRNQFGGHAVKGVDQD